MGFASHVVFLDPWGIEDRDDLDMFSAFRWKSTADLGGLSIILWWNLIIRIWNMNGHHWHHWKSTKSHGNKLEINGNIGKPMEKIWQHPLGIGSWAGCSNRRPPWGRCRWSRWSLSSHSLNKLPKQFHKISQTLSLSFHKFETWISVEHCGTLYLELKWRIHMNSTFRKKHELQVPVFFYGAAREDCRNSMEFQDHGRNSWRIHVEDLRSLAELRRCLGCATVSVHQADSDSDSDSDGGRYFSGAAKGEWCQPENVDRFFIIFNVFNFWNFKHSFSMFFCIFLSDFHQAFLQWSCETVKICEDLWRSVKICEDLWSCSWLWILWGPACPTKWRRPSSSAHRLNFDTSTQSTTFVSSESTSTFKIFNNFFRPHLISSIYWM